MLNWLRRKSSPAASRADVEEAGRAMNAGEDTRAIGLLEAHLRRHPEDPQALHLRAVAACRAGDFALAEQHLTTAAKLDPRWPDPALTLAEVHLHHARYDAAVEALRAALAADPQRLAARRRLMFALGMAGRQSEAMQMYVGLRLRAQGFDPPDNPAAALIAQGRFVDAEALLEGELRHRPDDPRLHLFLGLAREARGRRGPAADAYRDALRADPRFAPALRRLGFAQESDGRMDDAIESYRSAVAHAPDDPGALSDYLAILHYLPEVPREEFERSYRAWDERFARALAHALPPAANTPVPERRLRIGYVSADYYSHVTRHFIEPVLERHDRLQFDVYCYDNSPVEDAVTQRLRALPLAWRPCQDMDDAAVARTIRGDGIDILVDLNGHLAGNRLLAFARRPAPVQMTWLGYPNTTGLSAIDHWITDGVIAADLSEQYHAEAVLPLGGFFMPFRPGPLPDVAPAPPSARGAAATFGSFNLYPKLNARVFDAWSRLLLVLADSRLILFAIPEAAHDEVRGQFAARGVDAARLTVHDRMDHEAFLAAHGDVDVALDPFPCVGTTTTLFTLAMGVPLVTLAGHTHASRVSASALAQVGLERLVAQDVDSYVALAIAAAGDPAFLRDCRATLRGRLAESSIQDEAGFTRNLERAYREVWRRWCRTK
jgi:protein O-GlcNAc transferase